MTCKYTKSKKIEPLKPSCKKPTYNSLEEAQEMVRYVYATRVTRQIRPYKCPICGLWHLTSSKSK